MSLNNEYKRYFIILQEDDKGYEISAGKIPTGYVKIEIKNGKCRLTAFVQNVKSDDKLEYRFILVAPAKKAAVDLGRLMVDGSGRGELNQEFEADNVLRSGLEISDFAVAAVASSNTIPLSGYVGRDKIQWKDSYDIVNRSVSMGRIDKEKLVEEVEVPLPKKPYIEVEKPVEVIEEKPKEAPVETKVEEKKEKELEFKAEIMIEAEPIMEIKKEEPQYECKKQPQYEYDYYYHEEDDEEEYYKKHEKCDDKHKEDCEYKVDEYESNSYYESPMYKKLLKVVDRLNKYEPFDEKDRNYEWFRVEDDIYLMNSAAIPFMGSMMPLGYPYMMEECALMIGKKDYIFGVKYDKESKRHDRKHIKYVFYGIPGMYSKRDEMYYKMRGYAYYRPHKSHSYGYWIMCVDIRTGQVKM